MPDISNLKIGLNNYSIKDNVARTKAEEAVNKANTATSNVESFKTKVNNNEKKINELKLIGTYTQASETIELNLEK